MIAGLRGTLERCLGDQVLVATPGGVVYDVTVTRRTRAYHHYTVGGDLTIEDVEVLGEVVEGVTCRWCGPGVEIEELPASPAAGPSGPAGRVGQAAPAAGRGPAGRVGRVGQVDAAG